ncbi:pfh1, partial [Symbiodinium pilosum]
ILPLAGPGGQSAQLTRPNGALTRAGQLYYQLAGRRPPSRQFDEAQPLIREGASDFILLRSGVKKLLGKAFFKEKYTEWLAHVPVRIRGRRKNGWGYERQDYLPLFERGPSEAERRAAVLQQLGNPGEDDAIMELSEEEWTLSSQTTQRLDDRTVVETSLRQPLGALAQREVSYQLFKGDEVLASAFERRPDRLCAARQLAELLRLPLEEVLSDIDAICDRGWQERGITPEEIRRFCVWRGAPMFYVNCQGQLLDAYQPAEKEARAVAFTAWQGHAFFYKNARSVYTSATT